MVAEGSNDWDELARLAKSGDQKAAQELLALAEPAVHAAVKTMVWRESDRDDVKTDVLFRYWKAFSTWDERASFKTYTRNTIMQAIVDYVRTLRDQEVPLPESDFDDGGAGTSGHSELRGTSSGPLRETVNRETVDIVRECVARLDPRRRDVIWKYYFLGLKIAEIAVETFNENTGGVGVSEVRVSQLLADGMRQLRAMLGERGLSARDLLDGGAL